MLTDATANAMLDSAFPAGAGNTSVSLHSAFSATGANLIGSITSANFAAASSRAKALAAGVDVTVPGAASVAWIGVWTSGGSVFRGMFPNGGASELGFQVDVTNDKVLCEGHGLANDDRVAFDGDTAPTGLTEGTIYWVVGVISADPDSFQVALTQGGAAINITGQPGVGSVLCKVVVDVYNAAGTHTVSALSIGM